MPCKRGHENIIREPHRGECTQCREVTRIEYKERHKEKFAAYAKSWKLRNRDKVVGYSRKEQNLPDPTRAAPDHCECCKRNAKDLDVALALDHCHETDAFRGWLCANCNMSIGGLGDNLDGLLAAVAYLQRARN